MSYDNSAKGSPGLKSMPGCSPEPVTQRLDQYNVLILGLHLESIQEPNLAENATVAGFLRTACPKIAKQCLRNCPKQWYMCWEKVI